MDSTAPKRELIPLFSSPAIVMAPAATLEVEAAAAAAVPIVAASERRFAPLRTVWRAKDRLRRRGGGGWGERGKQK